MNLAKIGDIQATIFAKVSPLGIPRIFAKIVYHYASLYRSFTRH